MIMLLIIVFVSLAFLLFLITMNRNQNTDQRDRNDYYFTPDTSVYHHTSSISDPSENQSQNSGDWGGRDMSHDHHDHGSVSDSGGGWDWGGDSGGGDAGGGDSGGGGGE